MSKKKKNQVIEEKPYKKPLIKRRKANRGSA